MKSRQKSEPALINGKYRGVPITYPALHQLCAKQCNWLYDRELTFNEIGAIRAYWARGRASLGEEQPELIAKRLVAEILLQSTPQITQKTTATPPEAA